VALLAQTTLGVHEWMSVMDDARERFPELRMSRKSDLCYATTNRQEAVKTVAAKSDVLLVLGSANSSNSVRLAEVGRRSGAAAYLIDDADSLDLAWLAGAAVVGVTAGASAPEVLVQGLIDRLSQNFTVTVEEVDAARETVTFKLPRVLVS
jgi:4-hydroxy-3-methylbut-2-enyl diphosphate reductase